METVLSLDLEGVLIAMDQPRDGIFHPRPYGKEFLDGVHGMFDRVFLNTCSPKYLAVPIVQRLFGRTMEYRDWKRRPGPYGKINDFEEFLGKKLIHVEDSNEPDIKLLAETSVEVKRCLELGFQYVTILSWLPGYVLHDPEAKNDRELPRLLEQLQGKIRTK